MSRITLSAVLPAPLAERVRTIAEREDRTVSYVLGKLLEQALENDNAAPAGGDVEEPGEHPRHGAE